MATKMEEIKFMAREGKINFTGRKTTRIIYLAKYKCRIAVFRTFEFEKTSSAVTRPESYHRHLIDE